MKIRGVEVAAPELNLRCFEGSVFVPQVQGGMYGGRRYDRWLIRNSDAAEIQSGIATIRALLAANGHLILTFDLDRAHEGMANTPFLTINGRAVSISQQVVVPAGLDPLCLDTLFSRDVIHEPVQCPLGHVFERTRITFWLQTHEYCPGPGAEHRVTSLEVDHVLQERIQAIMQSHQRQAEVNAAHHHRLDEQGGQLAVARVETALCKDALKPRRNFEIGVGGAKLTAKITIRTFAKDSVVQIAKRPVKAIPFISILFGIVLAVERGWRGEYAKAAGEIASGFAATVPGWGTAASVAIDGVMLAHDIYEVNTTPGAEEITLTIEGAHDALGLDSAQPQTRPQIVAAFREASRYLHPDQATAVCSEEERTRLQIVITACRDALFQHYNV